MGITFAHRMAELALALSFTMVIGTSRAQDRARDIGEQELARVAGLSGASQEEALRAFLMERRRSGLPKFDDSLFYHEDQLRPALRHLFTDPTIGADAAWFLALIGVPEDLRLIIQSPPPPKSRVLPNRWAYSVACSLLDPLSELEWSFLRRCAINAYEDRWVDFGAIQTLKLIGSPGSRAVLEEVLKQNEYRARSAMRAIEYTRSNPSPLEASDIEELAARVAQIVRVGDWEGNGQPRYNQAMDKALVDSEFFTGEDRLTYTATFHKLHGLWRLRGMRETLQAFEIRGAVVKPQANFVQIEPAPVLAAPPPAPLSESLQPMPSRDAPPLQSK